MTGDPGRRRYDSAWYLWCVRARREPWAERRPTWGDCTWRHRAMFEWPRCRPGKTAGDHVASPRQCRVTLAPGLSPPFVGSKRQTQASEASTAYTVHPQSSGHSRGYLRRCTGWTHIVSVRTSSVCSLDKRCTRSRSSVSLESGQEMY